MGLLDRFKNRSKEENTSARTEDVAFQEPVQPVISGESVEVVEPSFNVEPGSGLHQVIDRMRSYGSNKLTLDLEQHGNDMNYVLSDEGKELERGVVTPGDDWFDAVANLYTEEESSERGAWKKAQIVTDSTLGNEGAVTASFTSAASSEVSTVSSSLAQPGVDLASEKTEPTEFAESNKSSRDAEADDSPAGFEESPVVQDDHDPFVQADSVAPASSLLSADSEINAQSDDIDAQNRFDRIMKRIEEGEEDPQNLPSFEEIAFASDSESTSQESASDTNLVEELEHENAVEAAQESYKGYSATDTGLIAQTGSDSFETENSVASSAESETKAEATGAEIESYIREEPALTDAELNDREFEVEDEALEAQEPTETDLSELAGAQSVLEPDESFEAIDPYAEEDTVDDDYLSEEQELAELSGEHELAEPYDEENTFDEEFTGEDELTDDEYLVQTDGIVPESAQDTAIAEDELASDSFEDTEFANTDFEGSNNDLPAISDIPVEAESVPLADVTHGEDKDVQGQAAVPTVVDEKEWEQDAFAATGTAAAGATYLTTQKADQLAPTSGANVDVSSTFNGTQNTGVSMPSKTQLATGNMVLTEAEVAQRLKPAQDALFGENGTARDVSTVLIRVRSLGSYYDALTHVRRDGFWDQQKTFELVPEEILDILQLKSDSYREGFGSPLAMMFRFTPGVPVEASFDYANEEAFVQYTDHLPAQQYVEELRMFPRTGANIPPHMNEALASWTL